MAGGPFKPSVGLSGAEQLDLDGRKLTSPPPFPLLRRLRRVFFIRQKQTEHSPIPAGFWLLLSASDPWRRATIPR